MARLVKQAVLLAAIFFLAACAQMKTVNFSKYHELASDKTEAALMPPAYVVQHKKPRVAILPFTDNSGTNLKNLGPQAADAFQRMTAQMGRYDVVERAQEKKLAHEWGFEGRRAQSDDKREEIGKRAFFRMGEGIDYVVLGSIDQVTPNRNQKPGYEDAKGNWIKPECTASVTVSVSAHIVNAKDITVATFSMQGTDTKVQEMGCRVGPGMARDALEKAIQRDGSVQMVQAIPIYGYVKQIMTGGGSGTDRIAYISLGESDGIRPGDKVKVMRTEEDMDPVSGKRDVRYQDIAQGVVAKNGLTGTESILVLDGDQGASMVRVGNVVEPNSARQKNAAFMGKLGDAGKTIWQTITR